MYFVFVQELSPSKSRPSVVECGWLSSFKTISTMAPSVIFDHADSFPSFNEADLAAKAAGCLRYVILCLPTLNYCECREIGGGERF